MKKLLIIIFGLQCVLFCIDLQEIENRKFYEVSIFSEENNILAKDSNIKNGSLAIYVFFTSNLVFEPNYFIINTKEKVLEKAHFADGDAHSKINIKQNEFKKVGDTLILANYMKFKWKDKSKGLLEVEEMDTISQKKLYVDMQYLIENNLPIPPIVVYDMRDL
ncbi:hypothetical protein [Helicobacter trogontum]|uniref:Uncharacterized protein n=1 Tax=Helicobacter trogontum TaxID=50960 RepID=A0A4U8T216_9HELI|nr:hypothetical protein [Helicobacter trogontum]TLD93353.1 hypothetical protein LS80_010695 [Helicobacter trogontum]